MDAARPNSPVNRPKYTLLPLDQSKGEVAPGSLLVSDVFAAGSAESHGVSVAKAAWSMGFRGPVYYQQAVSVPLPPLEAHARAAELLATPGLPTQMVEKALKNYVTGPPLHMLMSGVDEVDRAAESGARQCALNLSSGMCKAQMVELLYEEAARAWKSSDPAQVDQGETVVRNLSSLLSVDSEALVGGADGARAKFQQALVDRVDAIWNGDSEIEGWKTKFQESVGRFESAHNSVVIAAGNEGLVKPRLELESGGELRVPADFEENVLAGPEVTSVGATIILDGVEAPARYSSSWPGVKFYVSGDAVIGQEFDDAKGLGEAGSSLAAPRVAALMARLHAAWPGLESKQVESMAAGEFTAGSATVIDTDKAHGFLAGA